MKLFPQFGQNECYPNRTNSIYSTYMKLLTSSFQMCGNAYGRRNKGYVEIWTIVFTISWWCQWQYWKVFLLFLSLALHLLKSLTSVLKNLSFPSLLVSFVSFCSSSYECKWFYRIFINLTNVCISAYVCTLVFRFYFSFAMWNFSYNFCLFVVHGNNNKCTLRNTGLRLSLTHTHTHHTWAMWIYACIYVLHNFTDK